MSRGPGARYLTGLLFAVLVTPVAASELNIEGLSAELVADRVFLSYELVGAFPEQVEARLETGIEISFEYTARLRRKRRRFFDKTMSERYIVVSAQYSNLTRMYKLTRRIDGTVTDTELTDQEGVMRRWMVEVDSIEVFDRRDMRDDGVYYVRLKGKLQRKFALLFFPADVETDWVESERFEVVRGER